MPVPKLDAGACARRNAAAAMEGRTAAPMTLSASIPPPGPPDGYRVVTAKGKLPKDDADAVRQINDANGLIGTSNELSQDKVLLVYPEAANRAYIPKYMMFLGRSTMKNIAASGADGISFMNSHRTGGMSTPTTLPYGRSFCSRLETLVGPEGQSDARVILGAYMLSGTYPNGADGPSTNDLHAAIIAGTLNEVSLGFSNAGRSVCDVCGRDLNEMDDEGEYLCCHAPGTCRGMTEDQIADQKKRGVPGGVATVTLEDADVNELSAVYSGALVGAGFRKTARLARRNKMAAAELAEARSAYAVLLSAAPDALGRSLPVPTPLPAPQSKGTPVDPITLKDAFEFWNSTGRPEIKLADLMVQLGGDPTNPPVPANAGKTPTPAPVPALAPASTGHPDVDRQLAAMRTEFDAERESWRQEREQDRVAAVALAADAWTNQMIRAGRSTAAERLSLVAQYTQAAADDARNPTQIAYKDPVTLQPKAGGRLDVLKASILLRPASQAGVELGAANPAEQLAARAASLAAGADPATLDNDQTPPNEYEDIYKMASGWGERRNGTKGRRGMSGGK